MAPVYNTIPQADDEPLVQTKAAPTSIKKLIFTAAAASFVLGACAATVVAAKSAIGTYQFAAGSNGGCPPAGSTTEEDCKAAGCTWAPGVYPADVSTTGGVCVPTPGALEKCGPQHQCSADGCTCRSGNAPCSQAGLVCPVISCPNGSCDQTNAVATSGDVTCSNGSCVQTGAMSKQGSITCDNGGCKQGDAFAAKFVVCGKNQKCSGTPKSTRTATCTMGPDCMSYGDESEASNLGLSKGEVAAAGSILGNILGHL